MPKMGLIVGGTALIMLAATIITLTVDASTASHAVSVATVASQENLAAYASENLFIDPSIKGYPDNGALFGNGQTLIFKYDGSKSEANPNAVISYDLYYIRDDGRLILMGGGALDGRGSGDFRTSSIIFNRNAVGKRGVIELRVTYYATQDAGKTDAYGLPLVRQTVLGLFAITYDVRSVRY